MRFLLTLILFCCITIQVYAQQTVGLFTRAPGSQDGYVLFSPITSTNTYLIDKCGKSIHTWASSHRPAQSVYLLEDGTLLRPGATNNTTFTTGGNGGIIESFDWNGNVVWTYTISSTTECQHHDICPLPNGNVLAIVWESKTSAQAIAAGRNPAQIGTTIWSEKLVELQPNGANNATIVWEWHVWDHLVQDQDATKASYGTVSQHPELINLNYNSGNPMATDWLHMNSVAYNPALDQVMVSIHNFSELWVIDHSTTTAQAASHTGGTHGMGGDLLYRWGNPVAYGRGTAADRMLFSQHNAHWIEGGLPDSGKIMVFNNGLGRLTSNYSTVDVLTPPVDGAGNYVLAGSTAYGPASLYWQYQAPVPTDFYAKNISGAQRLSSGNTLICEGTDGTFFEVDNSGNTLWKYVNPITAAGPVSQGTIAQEPNFRCTQYQASYAGFTGHTLAPGQPLEQNPLAYNCTMPATGIHEIGNATHTFNVINPFADAITIISAIDMSDISVSLSNGIGERVSRWQASFKAGKNTTLDIPANLPEGFYFLSISSKVGGMQVCKLIHH